MLSSMADRVLRSSLYSIRNVYGMHVNKTSGTGGRVLAINCLIGGGGKSSRDIHDASLHSDSSALRHSEHSGILEALRPTLSASPTTCLICLHALHRHSE
jgi:hypothetical protein